MCRFLFCQLATFMPAGGPRHSTQGWNASPLSADTPLEAWQHWQTLKDLEAIAQEQVHLEIHINTKNNECLYVQVAHKLWRGTPVQIPGLNINLNPKPFPNYIFISSFPFWNMGTVESELEGTTTFQLCFFYLVHVSDSSNRLPKIHATVPAFTKAFHVFFSYFFLCDLVAHHMWRFILLWRVSICIHRASGSSPTEHWTWAATKFHNDKFLYVCYIILKFDFEINWHHIPSPSVWMNVEKTIYERTVATKRKDTSQKWGPSCIVHSGVSAMKKKDMYTCIYCKLPTE